VKKVLCKTEQAMCLPGCDDTGATMQLAHSYVPWQCYEAAFSPQEALMKGTLFPELYGPYMPPR